MVASEAYCQGHHHQTHMRVGSSVRLHQTETQNLTLTLYPVEEGKG